MCVCRDRFFVLLALALALGAPMRARAVSFGVPQTRVCRRALNFVLQSTSFHPENASPLDNLRNLRAQLDRELGRYARIAFDPILAHDQSARASQEKAADRLRGIELFKSRMGEGHEALGKEDVLLAGKLTGADEIQNYLAALRQPTMQEDDLQRRARYYTSLETTAASGSMFLLPSDPTYIRTAAALAFAAFAVPKQLAAYGVSIRGNGFLDFSREVTQRLATKDLSNSTWVVLGQQLKNSSRERASLLGAGGSGAPGQTMEHYAYNLFLPTLANEPTETIFVDHVLSVSEAGQPELGVYVRTSRERPRRRAPQKQDNLAPQRKLVPALQPAGGGFSQ
jgi:hypothetical protein